LATFEVQVEALTGIAIDGSSSPTNTELSVFLQDGVKDVIHRTIEVRPEELARFCSTTDSGSNAFVAKVGKILSVAREHDSVSILRKCTQIDPGDRYDATDVDSLNYRSKTNPGFYELNGKVHTVPVAAESGDNNVVVTQLFYDTGVAYGDEVPDNFPESYAYLVAIYAAIQSLHNNMADTTISPLSITTVPPDIPSSPSFTYVNAEDDTSIDSEIGAIIDLEGLGSAPTYTPPKIGGATEELTTTMGTGSSKTDFSDWFDQVGDYIETDEDVELAGAQLQKIGSYIGAYNAAMTNQLHEFNEANAKYQAEIKEHLQVSANEVTRLTTVYNKASDINLQNAVRTYQVKVDEYTQKISRYSAEVTGYNADVSREVQEYTNNLQRQGTNYQWRQGQMLKLQAQYDRAFIPPGAGGGE
jgi:hypothetical protein